MAEERAFGPVLIPAANQGRYRIHSVCVVPACSSMPVPMKIATARSSTAPRREEVLAEPLAWGHLAYLDLFEGLPARRWPANPRPCRPKAFLDWYGFAEEEFREYWRHQLTTPSSTTAAPG
ncbi:MAG: hypothetical protein KF766_08140 [Rhodocyclaceae bacterium]|nr:hypothetical protein [Rhodocyclaceae bacterium]